MKEETLWQQPTPTPLDSDLSYSPGITKLLELYTQINALHSTFVGTYCKLLTSSQKNTGTENTAPVAVHAATFVNYQQQLQDFIIRATDVQADMLKKRVVDSLTQAATSKPTNKP